MWSCKLARLAICGVVGGGRGGGGGGGFISLSFPLTSDGSKAKKILIKIRFNKKKGNFSNK